MLLLPLLMGFAFQATQYARAPSEYNFYVVYAKSADISLRPGTDLSPNGQTLIQNSTNQEGFYNLTLGQWGPGYVVNYTNAFAVYNREVFNIRMIGFNFSSAATGGEYMRISVKNDTNNDGVGDTWVEVWDGSSTTLTPNYYIYLKAASTYGTDGGYSDVRMDVVVPSTGVGISQGTPQLTYNGQVLLWFTSMEF